VTVTSPDGRQRADSLIEIDEIEVTAGGAREAAIARAVRQALAREAGEAVPAATRAAVAAAVAAEVSGGDTTRRRSR
jgi:hypothetical protein